MRNAHEGQLWLAAQLEYKGPGKFIPWYISATLRVIASPNALPDQNQRILDQAQVENIHELWSGFLVVAIEALGATVIDDSKYPQKPLTIRDSVGETTFPVHVPVRMHETDGFSIDILLKGFQSRQLKVLEIKS